MAQTIAVRVGGLDLLVEVTPAVGTEPTATGDRAGRAADYVAGAFERAQSAVEEIAVSTARMIGRMSRRVGHPEKVEVEFGVKVSAKGDVIVAGSSGEAALKVKIVYGADLGTSPDDADAEPDAAAS